MIAKGSSKSIQTRYRIYMGASIQVFFSFTQVAMVRKRYHGNGTKPVLQFYLLTYTSPFSRSPHCSRPLADSTILTVE